MLKTFKRKAVYVIFAFAAAVSLLGVPSIVPSAHAGCSTASSCNSGG